MPNYDDLIGRGFVYGARGPESYDCYGLYLEMKRRDGGIIPPDYGFSDVTAECHTMMTLAESSGDWVKLNRPEPGCLVWLRVKGYTCHVGYVLDSARFIHTWERSNGVTVELLSQWANRIEGFYRYEQ